MISKATSDAGRGFAPRPTKEGHQGPGLARLFQSTQYMGQGRSQPQPCFTRRAAKKPSGAPS
jgi:hypothetical protein